MPAKNDENVPFLRSEALERLGGDADFLTELLALFDEEYASKMEGLNAAVAGGDFKSVRELGHGLKGSSANLSLPGIRKAALAMENAGKAEDPAAAQKALHSLAEEYRKLKIFLR